MNQYQMVALYKISYSVYDFKLAVTSRRTLKGPQLKLARKPIPEERIRTRSEIYQHVRTRNDCKIKLMSPSI